MFACMLLKAGKFWSYWLSYALPVISEFCVACALFVAQRCLHPWAAELLLTGRAFSAILMKSYIQLIATGSNMLVHAYLRS